MGFPKQNPNPNAPVPVKPSPGWSPIPAPKAPAVGATPEPDLQGRGFLLQPWVTIRGDSAVVKSVTQDDALWMDLRRFADAGFWIDVSGVTNPSGGGVVFLNLEGSPTLDEADFRAVAPPLQLSPHGDANGAVTSLFIKTVRAASTVPLSRYTRWRISTTGTSGVYDASFRIRGIGGYTRFWSPLDIAGCKFWARADMGITMNSSNAVSLWADQSGAGHDASPGSGNQPTWIASVFNNAPAVNFDPSVTAQWLKTGAFAIGPWTVLMVTGGQNLTYGWFWTRGTGATPVDTFYGSTNQTLFTKRGATASAWDTSLGVGWGQWGTQAKLLTTRFDGTHAGHTLRINGADNLLNNNFTGDPGTGTTNDSFTIAAGDNGGIPAWIKVAEVILYDHALSSKELILAEEYLRQRYALY